MPLHHELAPVRFLDVLPPLWSRTLHSFSSGQPQNLDHSGTGRCDRTWAQDKLLYVGIVISWTVVSGVSPCLGLWTLRVVPARREVKDVRMQAVATDKRLG